MKSSRTLSLVAAAVLLAGSSAWAQHDAAWKALGLHNNTSASRGMVYSAPRVATPAPRVVVPAPQMAAVAPASDARRTFSYTPAVAAPAATVRQSYSYQPMRSRSVPRYELQKADLRKFE